MKELAPGALLAGYRIESLIGRGGMGVVYRATQIRLERVVALKVIAPELLDDDDVRRRFLAEARAAASVDHPNVIPVHDAGAQDGIAFIAMRYVPGDDLRSLVRRGGALDPREAAELVAQAAAALDAIHRSGFVHRDVKPANLLVDGNRHVYLTDFGLAKAVLTQTGGTRTGHWVGTLDYVSPEQVRGGRIDARADVYALGGVLHYALTGRVPFEREGDEAKLWAQLSAPPPVPSTLQPSLRGEFDVVVARAMAKAPEHRYPSAGDLGRAARAAVLGQLPTEPERVVARGAAAPDAGPTEPGLAGEAPTRTARPKPRARRSRAPLIVAGGAFVVVLAVSGALALRGHPSAPPGEPTPPAALAHATPTSTVRPRVALKKIRGVGDRPASLALAHGDVWVARPHSEVLTRVDATTGRVGRPIRVGRGVESIVARGDDVWLGVAGTSELLRLDARDGQIKLRIPVPSHPLGLAADAAGVWVAAKQGLLAHYDRDGGLLQQLTVSKGITAIATGGGAVWVVQHGSYTVLRLKPGSDRLSYWAPVPARAWFMHYAAGKLWITLQNGDRIARVDTATAGRQVTASVGHSPIQTVLSRGKLFVTSRDDHTVVVLDPRGGMRQLGTIHHVGLNPFGIVAAGRYLWVSALGNGTLTRIDYRR